MPPLTGAIDLSTEQVITWVNAVLLPFFRVGALMMTAPLLGTRAIPIRIRMAFTILVTSVIAPTLPPLPPLDPLSPEMVLTIFNQILVGVAMGFTLKLVFTTVELGGQIGGQLMGLGFASLMDPQNGVPVPIVSQFYNLLVTLLYLVLNGHLFALEALAESFRTLPIGPIGPVPETWWDVTIWGGILFHGALLIALPAIGALLLVNVIFAVATRATPAFNVFAIGFPITLGLGLFLIIETLPILVEQVGHLLRDAFEVVRGLPMLPSKHG